MNAHLNVNLWDIFFINRKTFHRRFLFLLNNKAFKLFDSIFGVNCIQHAYISCEMSRQMCYGNDTRAHFYDNCLIRSSWILCNNQWITAISHNSSGTSGRKEYCIRLHTITAYAASMYILQYVVRFILWLSHVHKTPQKWHILNGSSLSDWMNWNVS